MKIQFIGCGSAFTTKDYYQSNIIIHSDDNKKLLIDCGSDARFALNELGFSAKDLDSVFISHLHADHIGGLEWLAFCTYFAKLPRPKLYCNDKLMHELWDFSLKGGLESIQGKVVTLTEYFDCNPIANNEYFVWEGIKFTPVQTVHVMAGYYIKYSYGLLINKINGTEKIFITTDTQHCPSSIRDFYHYSKVIFHDCETSPYPSGVHANYDELNTLSVETKNKMWLYHYNPAPKQNPIKDGFLGFVTKGQIFEF
ncbi:MAG: MBL fold metallo-hydrolase [Nanoarchaeota archaeon]